MVISSHPLGLTDEELRAQICLSICPRSCYGGTAASGFPEQCPSFLKSTASRHPSPVRGETTFRFVKHTLVKIVNLLSHILLRKSVDLGEVEEILGKKKKEEEEVATIKEE